MDYETIRTLAITIAQIVGFLTIGATIIVRLTPSPKDDIDAEKINAKIWQIINWLPTIGINPRTKKIEEAYKDMRRE